MSCLICEPLTGGCLVPQCLHGFAPGKNPWVRLPSYPGGGFIMSGLICEPLAGGYLDDREPFPSIRAYFMILFAAL